MESIMESKKVKDLQSAEYTLVQDYSEVQEILKYLGCDLSYPTLIVSVRNGEYIEVWGCDNFLPLTELWADRLR